MLSCGKIQAYTGDGKGKTTAAFGLALRASAANLNVFIIQFMKNMKYGETILSQYTDKVRIVQCGSGCIFDRDINDDDKAQSERGIIMARELLQEQSCDILILDEVFVAISMGLITEESVLELLEMKSSRQEIVMTGRYASEKILAKCDLITEMKSVKHYFDSEGLTSRRGIEV